MHHIQAIKGGLVKKVLNVNYCGQPALKFKAIEDIYDAEDARRQSQVPTVNLRDDIESSPWKLKDVKEEVQSDSEASESNRKNLDGEENDDDDDFIGDMTLGQIKGRCRMKKRKLSTYASPVREPVEIVCGVNREDIKFEGDLSDLNEPLIILKRKVLKNEQKKKKRSRKQVSTSFCSAASVVNSQQRTFDQEIPQSNDDKPAPLIVKAEVFDPEEYTECQAKVCFRDYSPFSCYDQVYSTGVASNAIPETTDSSTLDTEFEGYPPEDDLNGVSDDIPYQFGEDVKPSFDEGVTGWEIVMIDTPEMLSCEFPDIPESSSSSCIIPYIPYDVSTDSVSPIDDPNFDLHDDSTDMQCQQNHCSETHDSFNCSSSGHDTSSQARCQGETQLPEMAPEINFHCSEDIDRGDDGLFEDINKEGNSSELEGSAIRSSGDYEFAQSLNSSDSPDGHSVSASFDLPSTDMKSPLSTVAEGAKCSPITFGPHEHVASPKLRGDYDNSKPQTTPQRLISTRKTISPTSQEKLCRALETTLMNENEHPECRGKLYFAKQSNHRILKAEGLQQFSGSRVTPILRKPKHGKSVLKDLRLSRSSPQQPIRCTTTQSYSENAIAFSNRQMRDIEALATKLTKELKSMKDVMKVRLQQEDTRAPTLKQNSDEQVRIAIENATRAEETTKKWLNMMARDCSRFCKIMKMTEDKSASENSLQKKRKITFADEAGEKLCHVKVFKSDADAPAMEPGHETQTVLVE